MHAPSDHYWVYFYMRYIPSHCWKCPSINFTTEHAIDQSVQRPMAVRPTIKCGKICFVSKMESTPRRWLWTSTYAVAFHKPLLWAKPYFALYRSLEGLDIYGTDSSIAGYAGRVTRGHFWQGNICPHRKTGTFLIICVIRMRHFCLVLFACKQPPSPAHLDTSLFSERGESYHRPVCMCTRNFDDLI